MQEDPKTLDLLDSRIVKRMIAAGRVAEEEYGRYLESLEDCSSLAAETTTRLIATGGSRDSERSSRG